LLIHRGWPPARVSPNARPVTRARPGLVACLTKGQAVNYGTRPLGALAGGFLGTVLGLRPTLWIAAIGGLAGFAVLLPSPLPRFRLPSSS
jgi:predicted MFS family arabinose efflux permease